MIGIFGGTFDPIHEGHLQVLRTALARFPFTKIVVVPTGQNPHKRELPLAGGRDRVEMARLAVASLGDSHLEVDDSEVRLRGPSFTVDTVERLKASNAEPLVLLLGNEVFASLPRWKEPHRLLELASCLVVRRQNDLPCDFETLLQTLGFHRLSKKADRPGRILYTPDQWVEEMALEAVAVSATSIRKGPCG
jgi:nicotinate-nucleotide adenylyltransferase